MSYSQFPYVRVYSVAIMNKWQEKNSHKVGKYMFIFISSKKIYHEL